jgi:6-pyruvoyltetrahydropterin/6-carboxytetrahydropterin synthase
MIQISHDFAFEAAHRLPKVAEDHKCSRLHGHSYRVTLQLQGEMDPEMGWFIDFGDVETAVRPLIEKLDHHLLNEVEGLENPTSEVLAVWLYDRLIGQLDGIAAVTVFETLDSSATYHPAPTS